MSSSAPSKLSKKWVQIVTDRSGLALTEFALSLPILMMLCVSFIELAHYVNAYMRVNQIALSVADNTGRVRQTIDVTDVDAAMIGARISGENIEFGANGRVIVSMVEANGLTGANAGQMIRWQRCFGAKNVVSSYGLQGAGSTNSTYATGFGPTGRKIVASTADPLMMVEVVYSYKPIFPIGDNLIASLNGKTIRALAAFPVRDRTNNVLLNSFNLPADKQRLCSTYTAT